MSWSWQSSLKNGYFITQCESFNQPVPVMQPYVVAPQRPNSTVLSQTNTKLFVFPFFSAFVLLSLTSIIIIVGGWNMQFRTGKLSQSRWLIISTRFLLWNLPLSLSSPCTPHSFPPFLHSNNTFLPNPYLVYVTQVFSNSAQNRTEHSWVDGANRRCHLMSSAQRHAVPQFRPDICIQRTGL